jgi:hypothetical protein
MACLKCRVKALTDHNRDNIAAPIRKGPARRAGWPFLLLHICYAIICLHMTGAYELCAQQLEQVYRQVGQDCGGYW